jgi:hypothetical protein
LSPISDPGTAVLEKRIEIFQKERKRSKKKETVSEGESLWKLPQLRKSIKVAFGNNLLMISTAA